MIVEMKKVTLIVQSKDVEPTLRALGKIGVLHIEHQVAPVNEDVLKLKEEYQSFSRAIEALHDVEREGSVSCNIKELVYKILELIREKEIIVEGLREVKKDIEIWKEWGYFDPELIRDLEEKKIWVRLCKVSKKEAKKSHGEAILERLFKKGNILYCAIISREDIQLPFVTLSLPDRTLQEMLIEERKEEKRLNEIDIELARLSECKHALVSYRKKLESLIEFNEARAGMGTFEKLSYLRGYCPIHNVNSLDKVSKKERWALIVEDPSENDLVPTLIKNPRWVEIIKPVFQMIKTIPGYKEVDISLYFLLFFSIFFGMLIGDAGYGAVFFIINLVCHVRLRKRVENKSIFLLLYVLSSCAIIWGLLQGTFFGQAYSLHKVEPLLPYLRDNVKVQGLCFFIGALHLTIAHLWKFIRKFPSLKAFSEAGWVCILWAAYFLAKGLILHEGFPQGMRWVFVVGAGLVILFTNPSRNTLKLVGAGIGSFLLHIVNSFTDIVSYIRLFAVGTATVAVADAFNHMALEIGYSTIVTSFFTALILLFGHTLNILLGAMAVLVHGVRLNVLEFSSHLDMEWSGIEYAPFKETE